MQTNKRGEQRCRSRIAELYDLWYEQRDKVVQTYQTAGDDRVPLSQNKTFHPIRNVVVTEALKLTLGDSVFEKILEDNLTKEENAPPVVRNTDSEETEAEVSVAEQLAEKLEKESAAGDETSKESRWQFAKEPCPSFPAWAWWARLIGRSNRPQ